MTDIPPGAVITLEGAPNTRDLGGHRAADGRTIATGRLVRSESLARLTDADLERLRSLGLRLVIDFRTHDEVRFDGPDRLPADVPRLHLPVGGGVVQQLYGPASSGDSTALQTMLEDGGAEAIMKRINRGFVVNDDERRAFATAVRRVVDDELPLLFHCTAGKDRTGWMAAVLLTILGVDRDTVIDDYLESNRHYLPKVVEQLSSLPNLALDPQLLTPLFTQVPEYLLAGFAAADDHYGGFEPYVRTGLGISDTEVAALRTTLLVDG